MASKIPFFILRLTKELFFTIISFFNNDCAEHQLYCPLESSPYKKPPAVAVVIHQSLGSCQVVDFGRKQHFIVGRQWTVQMSKNSRMKCS
jgi:hypothetical protein